VAIFALQPLARLCAGQLQFQAFWKKKPKMFAGRMVYCA
jgi:hypothetical protein